MQMIKNWFSIETPYRFEWNDLRAFIQIINVALIMMFGLSVAWLGLAIALFGVIKDMSQHRHINDIVLHLTGVILNIHFLLLYYRG
jgi:hypothetical protein